MDDSGRQRPVFGRGRARNPPIRAARYPSPPSNRTEESSSSVSSAAGPSSDASPTSSSVPSSEMAQLNLSEASTSHFPDTSGFSRGEKHQAREPRSYSNSGNYVKSVPEGHKPGKEGRPIDMRANYFRLKSVPSWILHQYSVSCSDEDRTGVRKKLFRKAMDEHQAEISYMFDGAQLFTAKRLEDAQIPLEISAKLDKDEDPKVTIKITYVKTLDSGSPVYGQLYNILIKKCLYGLELEQMGRNFFDPKAAIHIDKHKLELWPGKFTSF